MNLRQIEAFRAVMMTGSVTEAGRLMHISQPSVSRLIADLEHSAQLILFERRHGRLVPTPEAGRLYEEVERAFIGLGRLRETAREIKELRGDHLRIAAMPALCLDLVPSATARLLARFPDLRVSVQARSSEQVFHWLQTQQFDVGLAGPASEHGGIDRLLEVSAACVCVLPAAHALAARPAVDLRDLADVPLILGPDSLMVRRRLNRAFDAIGVHPNVQIETPLSIVACALVERDLGIAVTEPFTLRTQKNDRLAVRPLTPEIRFSFEVLAPRTRLRSRAAAEFLGDLEQVLAGLADARTVALTRGRSEA